MDCCGEKIVYFLKREHEIHISASKVYEILNERLELRSKWKKNQARGLCPNANGPREVVQMDSIDFGQIFAFTAVDIHSKEAEVILSSTLTAKEGKRFLEVAMERRFDGYSQIIQTDGGSEFEAEFKEAAGRFCLFHRVARPYKKNEQSFIESFNRTVRKEFGLEQVSSPRHSSPNRASRAFLFHRPYMGLHPMRPPLPLAD